MWIGWLFEARRRFGLCVLNFQVTSNRVHLIVRDRDRGYVDLNMVRADRASVEKFSDERHRKVRRTEGQLFVLREPECAYDRFSGARSEA